MGMPSKTVRALVGVVALLTLANCATTQESVQDCRKAAFSFCDKTMAAKEGASGAASGADAGARRAAYQQCLEPQLAACGVQ
jgi:uncharacterized lipoprotein YajG